MFDRIGSDPSLKTAIVVSKNDNIYIQIAFSNIKVIQQSFMLAPQCLCTYRNNFAFKVTDYVMSYLCQGGIAQYMQSKIVFNKIPSQEDEPTPSVFGLKDLEFGFIIWLIACSASVIFFLIEIFWFLIRVKFPELYRFMVRYIALLYLLFNAPEKVMRLY